VSKKNNLNIILTTQRTYLRAFNLLDLDLLYNLHKNPDVMHYFASGPRTKLQTLNNLKYFIAHQTKYNFSEWAVFEKDSHKFIGRAGPLLWEESKEIEIGYVLNKNFWGLGFATELAKSLISYIFSNLNFKHIIAVTAANNLASRRVLEKSGLKFNKNIILENFPAVQYIIKTP